MSNCKEIQNRQIRGERRLTCPQHPQQQRKGKNVVTNQDGFQQIKNKRRNIFDAVDDKLREIVVKEAITTVARNHARLTKLRLLLQHITHPVGVTKNKGRRPMSRGDGQTLTNKKKPLEKIAALLGKNVATT